MLAQLHPHLGFELVHHEARAAKLRHLLCVHNGPTAAHICVGNHSDRQTERADHPGGLEEVVQLCEIKIRLGKAGSRRNDTLEQFCVSVPGDNIKD